MVVILTAWLFIYLYIYFLHILPNYCRLKTISLVLSHNDGIFISFMITCIIQWLQYSILWEELRHGNLHTSVEIIRAGAGLTDQHAAGRSGILGVFWGLRGSQLCVPR